MFKVPRIKKIYFPKTNYLLKKMVKVPRIKNIFNFQVFTKLFIKFLESKIF